jgi:hypothetical protein
LTPCFVECRRGATSSPIHAKAGLRLRSRDRFQRSRLYDVGVLGKRRKKTKDGAVEQRQVLDAMLAFSQTQLLAQVTDEASLDSRTIGLLAFNGALLGGTLAAKTLLGYYWWAPLIVVALATGPCLWSVFKKTSAFGPPALRFYKEFGAPRSTQSPNAAPLRPGRHVRFQRGEGQVEDLATSRILGSLVVGLGVAALLIAVVRPTTMKTCKQDQIRVQVQGSQSLSSPVRTSACRRRGRSA